MSHLPGWLQAGFWGWVAGMALLIGAFIGYRAPLSRRIVAAVMAFGAGILISALSLDLMIDAVKRGGMFSTALGFLAGSAIYTAANLLLNKRGAKHRKRSGQQQTRESDSGGSGTAIALGALMDGIPESIVIGVSLLGDNRVSFVTLAAIFLSNLPEGISSSAGMKNAGRSKRYIFGVWAAIALISGAASILGYTAFSTASEEVIAAVTAVAAGAILSMLADTMMPEAFEEAGEVSGLITVLGFLAAFLLSDVR